MQMGVEALMVNRSADFEGGLVDGSKKLVARSQWVAGVLDRCQVLPVQLCQECIGKGNRCYHNLEVLGGLLV